VVLECWGGFRVGLGFDGLRVLGFSFFRVDLGF